MKVYVTHCSAKKDGSFKESNVKTTPYRLYTAAPTRRFMNRCKQQGVERAIFSDKHGVWFFDTENDWYEKDQNSVNVDEFADLVRDFDMKLSKYDEILFYYNPGRFHRLYKRLIDASALKGKVKAITHLEETVR